MKECNKPKCSFGVGAVSATVHSCVRSDMLRAGERRLLIGVYGGSRFVRTVLRVIESVTKIRFRVVGFAWKHSLMGKELPCTLGRAKMICHGQRTSR